jgi:hypothetical protein
VGKKGASSYKRNSQPLQKHKDPRTFDSLQNVPANFVEKLQNRNLQTTPPFFQSAPFSFFNEMDQIMIQYVPINVTYKTDEGFDRWKTISFLLSHKAQQKAATPISFAYVQNY